MADVQSKLVASCTLLLLSCSLVLCFFGSFFALSLSPCRLSWRVGRWPSVHNSSQFSFSFSFSVLLGLCWRGRQGVRTNSDKFQVTRKGHAKCVPCLTVARMIKKNSQPSLVPFALQTCTTGHSCTLVLSCNFLLSLFLPFAPSGFLFLFLFRWQRLIQLSHKAAKWGSTSDWPDRLPFLSLCLSVYISPLLPPPLLLLPFLLLLHPITHLPLKKKKLCYSQ